MQTGKHRRDCLPVRGMLSKPAVVLLAGCLGWHSAAGAGLTNTIAAGRAYITNLMTEHNIPGLTIALVNSQEVVWAEAFGYADLEQGIPATTNTVMMIGSVSKLLTSFMALQLMDEGVFDLDANITNYVAEFSMLPRFPGQAGGWTLRAMMHHRSGIPGDIYNGAFSHGPYWPDYTRWLIEYFQGAYPLYPPGLFASYCNSGFNVAGEAIARRDGADYTAAAETRVFSPLQMPYSSFLLDKPAVAENLATGYAAGGLPVPWMLANMPATGGAFSRPLDMANVIKMLLAGGVFNGSRYLSTNALFHLANHAPGPLDVDNYLKTGLGLDTVDDPALNYAGRAWAKNGSTSTFEALLEILPDQQLGIFININCANNMTLAAVRKILADAVKEKTGLERPPLPPMPSPAETNLDQAALQAVAGYYVTKDGVDLFLAETNGTLSCVRNAQTNSVATTNYRPHVNGRFFIPGKPELQMAFTNLAGYDVIVCYGCDGTVKNEVMYGGYAEYLYGARYAPPAVSAAWSNRCGRIWFADNLLYSDYNLAAGSPSALILSSSNGILSLEGIGSFTLEPANDNLAFAAGLTSRSDGSVRVVTNAAGREQLWFGGYHCVDMADIPVISNREAMTVSPGLHSNAMAAYHGGIVGRRVTAMLSSNAADAVVRAISLDSMSVMAVGTGMVSWICDAAPALINISASNTVVCQLRVRDYAPMAGDFDGDGLADPAVMDEAGNCFVWLSGSGYARSGPFALGAGGLPAAGDYDGDGRADPGIVDAGGGWHVWFSRSGYAPGGPYNLGIQGMPAAGDYDGDGRADPAVVDEAGGWHVWSSGSGYAPGGPYNLGIQGMPAAGDYDGDGRADPGIVDAGGNWHVWFSRSGYAHGGPYALGIAGMPAAGDYDGDGQADPAVVDAGGGWYVWLSASGYNRAGPFAFAAP